MWREGAKEDVRRKNCDDDRKGEKLEREGVGSDDGRGYEKC